MRRPLALVLLLALIACSRSSSAPQPHADEPATIASASSSVASPLPSAPPTTAASIAAPEPSDTSAASGFEDQFEYGMIDAGPGDPSLLTTKKTFSAYANPRFGFSLDVPDALTAMPEPDNGDGMQWRLGHLVSMTASGMNWMPDLGAAPCPSGKNVLAHKETKTSCFATGKENGFIYWERHVISHDVDFSLRFQYVEAVKPQMDAIVTHVNASWKF